MDRRDINIIIEGAPALYVPAAVNETDSFVITIGGRPLLAGHSYSHRGDENCRGLFSCGFSPEWCGGVSRDMLWRFEFTDGGFYIRSIGAESYLSASAALADGGRDEKVTLELGEKTEFYLTNEHWIAFDTPDGEFYLSYHHSRGFIAPSGWTSSMTDISDVRPYAAVPIVPKECVITFDAPDHSTVSVTANGRSIASGQYALVGEVIRVDVKTDADAVCLGWRINGYRVPMGGEYVVYRDSVIEPIIYISEVTPGGAEYLSFISDVHDLPRRLDAWLSSLPCKLKRCVFGGDITAGNVKSIAAQQAAHEAVGKVVMKHTGEPIVTTIGNHEYEYSYRWGGRRIDEIFPDTVAFGEALSGDRYVIYNFGASEFDHDDFQSNFPDERVADLAEWLANASHDKVIFINAHYPLHAVPRRPKPNGAGNMIKLLSEHPNVIYLWGHNHGQRQEDGYGRILTRGDTILYDHESGAAATLGFTYASHGAMYDAARTVAPYYGLVARVSDGMAELTYYDMSGSPVPYKTAAGVGDAVTFTLEI